MESSAPFTMFVGKVDSLHSASLALHSPGFVPLSVSQNVTCYKMACISLFHAHLYIHIYKHVRATKYFGALLHYYT
jgi:hypothetical protein